MPNAVLERLREDRGRQVTFIDEMLARVDAEARDLVDAETSNLDAARERIEQLSAQIAPLEEFEALRARHQAGAPVAVGGGSYGGQPTPLAQAGAPVYSTPGQFMVDLIRARGFSADRNGQRLPADPEAQRRVNFVLQNQTTADTPGILPEPVVGSVVNLIDASRPFITSIGGARPMGGIPGKTFGRPKITQHVQVGPQSAEKAELPSRKMIIGEVPFTKATYGGAVDVSRQDIDWSSPAAWDILVRDLADVYAQETENAAADDFVANAADHAPNQGTTVPSNDLEAWNTALYQAAGLVYASSKKLPDRIWVSTDQWSALGPLFDTACCSGQTMGTSSFASFAGNMWTVPRIVVPSFPAGTVIIGNSNAYEVYEEAIGLLTAVEPSLLGVEVAYGGYIANAFVAPEGVAPITPPAPVGTTRSTSASSKS